MIDFLYEAFYSADTCECLNTCVLSVLVLVSSITVQLLTLCGCKKNLMYLFQPTETTFFFLLFCEVMS